MSSNPNITWEMVQENPENPDKPWDWYGLSRSPSITWEIVLTSPDKDWNWEVLSKNPNITWEMVQANPDKLWDWWGLSHNQFEYNNTIFKNKYCKREQEMEDIYYSHKNDLFFKIHKQMSTPTALIQNLREQMLEYINDQCDTLGEYYKKNNLKHDDFYTQFRGPLGAGSSYCWVEEDDEEETC